MNVEIKASKMQFQSQPASQKLVSKLMKDFKTLEDAKLIYSEIKHFSFFNKFIDNHFSNSMDEAVLYLCKNMVYEKYAPGSLILNEGDKSNNKFYVVLSGEVSILIRNSENVFISENLQRKFLLKMNKERHSYQESSVGIPPEIQLGGPNTATLLPRTPKKPRSNPHIEAPHLNLSHFSTTNEILNKSEKKIEKAKNHETKDKVYLKKNLTVIGIKTKVPPKKESKKMSLKPGILASQSFQLDTNDLQEISEEETSAKLLQKKERDNTPQVQSLPFFHLGKEMVLHKLQEMGYTNKDLYKGEGFGEVALLDSKARRTATVIALTPVELIVILKKDFLLIRQKFSHEYKAKKKFLGEVLPFFKMISSSSTIDYLIFCFKEVRLNNRQRVISEMESIPEKVYFLMKGKCKIEKTFVFVKDGLTRSRVIHICDVDYKGIFGEEILFEKDQEKYHYTVTVVSEEALFFTISKNAIMGNFPKEIKGYLYETFLMKRNMRNDIFEKCSNSLLKNSRNPEIQTMVDLKVGQKEKIITNLNNGLRLNYYQKLKNTVNEDFLNCGGSKTTKNWDSEQIFENIKRSILERKGLEKIAKIKKGNNTGVVSGLIRKNEKNVGMEEELGEISNFYVGDTKKIKNSSPRSPNIDSQQWLAFNFNGEEHNHRLEVFRKAKIGNFKGPLYNIPHDRIYMNLWEKAHTKPYSPTDLVNGFTNIRKVVPCETVLNGLNLKENKKREDLGYHQKKRSVYKSSTSHFSPTFYFPPSIEAEQDLIEPNPKKTNPREIFSSLSGGKSKAKRNLRVFLRVMDSENTNLAQTKRMHASQKELFEKSEKHGKFLEKFSFSKHLLEVKRNNSSLRKKTRLGTTQTSIGSWKSGIEIGIYEKKIV